jgi:hypothetical protein
MRAASRRPQHRPSSKELVLQGWGHAEGVGTSSRHKQQANGISPFRLKNEAKPLNLQASWANTCGSWAFSRSRKWRRKFGGEPTGAGEGIRTLDPNLGKTADCPQRSSQGLGSSNATCIQVATLPNFRQVTRRSVRAVRAMISSRSSCSKTAYRATILMPDHPAIWQSARRLPPRLRNQTAK